MKCAGLTTTGKQRFQCLVCRITLIRTNKLNHWQRTRVWFERWIREGYSIRQLMTQSGHSRRSLQQIILYWLQHPPVVTQEFLRVRSIVLDGTYIEKRRQGAFVCLNGTSNEVIEGMYGIKEGSREMFEMLLTLKHQGLSPKSATIDGLPSVYTCLKQIWPEMIIQRCVVHVQRQGLMWCRRFPKRTDAKVLRRFFLRVTSIDSREKKDSFLSDVKVWDERYGSRLASTTEKGWVISDLRRARTVLLNALPNMFHYLDNPSIPKSTNAIEGYFSIMKGHYRRHRGISKTHRPSYFQWYFYFGKQRSSNTK